MSVTAIVLAAGKSKRMGSGTPKVLLPLRGRTLLSYVLDAVREAGAARIVVVVGEQREEVIASLAGERVEFVIQAEQLGTAHAVGCCRDVIDSDEECLVVCGDVPLITGASLRRLLDCRRNLRADMAVLTAVVDDPSGYGRIVRDRDGWLLQIVEERDASEQVRKIREVNAGSYAAVWGRLMSALDGIRPSPVTGEYYLTDAVREVQQKGGRVAAVLLEDPAEMVGVNTPEQLKLVEKLIDNRRCGG